MIFRVCFWSCAIVSVCALITLIEELVLGPDHFYVGRNASVELAARVRPITSDLELTVFSASNPYYILENHSWMFFHFGGDVMRHPRSGSPQDTIKATTFLLGGRRDWMRGGKVIASYYWLNIPGFLPSVAAGAALGAIWCRRRNEKFKNQRAGFPLNTNERSW